MDYFVCEKREERAVTHIKGRLRRREVRGDKASHSAKEDDDRICKLYTKESQASGAERWGKRCEETW